MSTKEGNIFDRLCNFKNTWNKLMKNKAFKFGLPFVTFVIGGSFGLKEWTTIRYQFAKVKGVSKEEAEKMGLHKERDVTLESTYEEIQKLDIDNWENKRGPRPWEESGQQAQSGHKKR
ncbi:cytochrome c oxidase assembly protein COX16 homolog, mitochondrial [Aricia agestis]|uniref:cytochrome c oxidase assembly protein COX16 homolog, mitochondrial n=1 Tax=Aricia agestis TaxID=91739 RepID=UPI001C203555|nr:cytochrome c oxidase assembly protein COX16 homolog, mitochondrial [Aricia agestis]